jgi:glutamate dehydrogenase
VSRGGIRWSDRHDDYRTEILGLMKAQKVKNSVIIPSGAKGGFILKEAAINSANGELKKCIIQCYQQFIRGLLDVSDNMKDGIVCHPANVVCRDDFDPYFVVAADKGTADLSDYANSISNEYSFWLGDAFASGGSNGYDHKKLGITARGAWESLKRSLQELNLSNSVITAVGVGDMSGDVFGNGFIYSDKIKLLAAFDHRHIFIDPNPIPDVSYQERLRLFKLPTSSWDDYSKILLSDGGGIYKRSEKSIKLSPQAKEALGIDHDELTPDQLICYILKAPVDLLYNGGIGTYVKASHETSENVGDKTNEFCRVNGNELRCKIVCEGGNLGFTQLARVEYALNGGQINTDFIDNSAGVDCSDHEVNIKILLNSIVNANHMTIDERNKILAEMEQDVSNIVLNDNYSQALVMSFSSMHSHAYSDLYIDHIKRLEEVSNLDRTIENLPTNEELINRKAAGKGLTKPELAVLLAYTKIYVKEEILKSSLPDNPFFDQILISSFPARLTTEFKDSISDHILRREIIATQISNNILNTMGVTFPFRLQDETGASISNIAIAHTLASLVYNTSHLYSQIQSFDNKIPVKSQYELLHTVRVLLNMSTRWFLRNCSMDTNLSEIVENYKSSIGQLSEVIPNLVVGSTKNYVNKITIQFIDSGLPTDIAQTIALSRVMYTALNISAVSSTHEFDLVKTAKLYFHIGSVFNLVWFRDTLANDNRHGKRSNLARLTLRDDLDTLQRRLTISIMQSDMAERDVVKLVSTWISDNKEAFERWNTTFKNLMECQSDDYTMYFIALRELSDMVSDTNMSERVSLLAYHDALTKLPNRFAIADRIDQLQKRSQTEDIKFAVHFIDVDKFKEINDNYGHAVGDKLLIEITKRLLSTVRSGDTVARQGGDEFIIIQTELSTISDAKQLADKLLRLIKEPIMIDNHCLNVSASIGVAVYPSHGNDPMELLTNADKAMYHSKSSGRSQVSIHKSSTSIA